MHLLEKPMRNSCPIVALCAVVLTGCSTLTTLAPVDPGSSARITISGRVHGGQQAVVGSVIQLNAVGTTGYGSAPTGLINATNQGIPGKALTDALGNFNLAGTFTCPTGATQVYLTATGGNPGLSAGTNNSALVLMAPVGRCDSLGAGTFLNIDEVSTIAAVYPLAQFMDPATGNIGSYSAATTGLLNAFVIAPQLYNAATGLALNTVPNGTASVPQSEIHSLANIIAPCVNSAGPGSAACSALFSATTPSGGAAPTTTLTAALSIALHPGSNVANIFALSNASAPFQPSLSSAPNDFTVSLNINSGASFPVGLAVDTAGNLWIADTSTGGTAGRLEKILASGIPASGSPYSVGTNSATGIAIDTSGSIWITNKDINAVTKFLQSGAVQAGPFAVGAGPNAIAFDTSNNAWVTNSLDGNGSVSVINSSGTPLTAALTPSGIHVPISIAIDQSGNAWITSNASASIEKINSSFATVSPSGGYTGGGIVGPRSVSVDASSNIWTSNSSADVISEFTNSGTPAAPSGFSGAGVASSTALAIDGSGHIWTASQNNNYVSELDSAGTLITPTTGYKTAAMSQPLALAIDASGNVWVSSANKTFVPNFAFQSNLALFLGVATPTVTPIAQALKTGFIGVPPGTPAAVGILSSSLPLFIPSSAYNARLQASGGSSGSFTWTVTSGTLPPGITLAANGVLSGTSTSTAPATFTVKAADSAIPTNFATASLTLNPSTTLAGGTNNFYLNGSYVFRFTGFKAGTPSTTGTVTGMASIGQITFDGSGNLSGTVDFNSASSASSVQTTMSGTYNVGADQRGVMVLTPVGGSPIEYDIAVSNIVSNVAHQINLIEHDFTNAPGSSAAVGAGIAKLQNAAFFTTAAAQPFVFGLDGETACNSCSSASTPFGGVSLVGQITNASGTTSGRADGAAQDTTYNVTLSGSYTTGDPSTGRGTLTLTPSSALFPGAPTHFVYYVVDNTEIFLMSTDGHTASALLSGDALAQSGTFNSSTLSGSYISMETFANAAGGAANYPVDSAVGISDFTVSTSNPGNFTFLSDKINQGVVTLENTNGGALFPYSLDSTGRMTLFGGAAGIPVFYFANATSGFGTEQPTSGHTPGLFTVQQQVPGSYSCTSPAGPFVFGSVHPPTMIPVASGNLSLGASSVPAVVDISNSNGALSNANSFSYSCATDSFTAASGRLILTVGNSTSILYVISPTSAVVMDATSGSISPGLYVLKQ